MMLPLSNLTIVSITFNNPGVYKTIKSLKPLMESGAHVLIQNGGAPLSSNEEKVAIYNESDEGIYDGLNRGIRKVGTPYFMLLHAGDEFIGSCDLVIQIIFDLSREEMDLSLNSQLIGNRKHSSRLWKPWMLHLGAQPPHLPCVYRTSAFKSKMYRLDMPVIADFDFFKSYPWTSYMKHNYVLVHMERGGATSGGAKSFLRVSKLMIKHYGLAGCLMSFFRVPLKVVQMIF